MTATSNTMARKPRRTAAAPEQAIDAKTRRRRAASDTAVPETTKQTKLDIVLDHLVRPEGASLVELVAATGWQAHSVRGALAGSLKKKGHAVISEKVEGERR
jgi:hypothetical protein